MTKLNLPEYNFNIRQINDKTEILDKIRKKYIALTPEEWVRQNFVMFLINEKKVPESLISIEKQLVFNRMLKRTDIVVYNNLAIPKIIVECKSPKIKISQKVFEQIARYNMTLKVDYLIVTNGLQHFYCLMDYEKHDYKFIKELPNYDEL